MKPADPASATSGPAGAQSSRRDLRRRPAVLWNGATRALVVVFGGLLTLQGSDRLDASKVVYLALAGIAFAGSVVATWNSRTEPLTTAMRPWLVASVAILGLVALSLPVAVMHGSSAINWLRDSAAYVLIGAAPWLAIDLARSASSRLILGTGLIAGLLGAASFMIAWVQRRHLVDLPIDRITLPSMTLGAVAYCIAIACAVRCRGWPRIAWILLTMAILASFLVTGTRTSFVFLAAPIAVIVVDVWLRGRAGLAEGALPAVAQIGAVAVILYVSFGSLAPIPPSLPVATAGPSNGPSQTGATSGPIVSPGPDLEDRFSTIDDVLSGRDQSLQLRIEQTRIAWHLFLESPVVGIGPGHEYSYLLGPGFEYRSLTLDTPFIVLAKFGILGLLLTAALGVIYWSLARTLIQRRGPIWQALSLVGYGAVLVALIPLGWPPEDKGTGFALVFLLALAAVELGQSTEPRLDGGIRLEVSP